jgi:hypothetical protein
MSKPRITLPKGGYAMTGIPLTTPLLALSFALAPALPGDRPPPSCPARAAVRPPAAAPLPPAHDPGLDGSWLDCYAACVEAQWPRCVAQCGSYDPTTNPCLAICYDAIALGCAIGCSHWGVVPYTVDQTAP